MRKNKLFIAVIVFVAFIVFSGCAKRGIKNIDSKGTNIICFGDSITFGYGANPGEDYPSMLAKLINAPVINAGIDADTTSAALKRLKSSVLDKEPLLVIVELSGNDFLKKIPKEESINNVKEIVGRIQSKGAMVAIVDISAGLFLREYRSSLKKIAREKQAIFISSTLKGIITNPSMKSDFIHPNAHGYKMIAQRIYNAIMPYLQQNTALRESKK